MRILRHLHRKRLRAFVPLHVKEIVAAEREKPFNPKSTQGQPKVDFVLAIKRKTTIKYLKKMIG